MKTLFIIVSALAFLYLVAQTSFVQSKMANFKFAGAQAENAALSHSLIDTSVVSAKANEDKIVELEQKLTDLNLSNKALQARVDNLTAQLMPIPPVAEAMPNQSEHSIVASRMNTPIVSNGANNRETTNINHDQQKRLQQQAILRDLAVKMELSALHSLSR